ncbi:chemotaxis response regulator protein-glutamate methylesterase [Psychrosphaera ytuae]|uniref:Protein-glutamate methylesterase/protein-glutamine glutaminase n=1 Tax=Psychrosphaera ytuae TaxID=2820710 RepID=A0A975DBA7_9GAMM|nr:chemotaxis response regulator protein-glutamate methylesterase [Psychrosphaera ytuae]QTH63783.1 chemotaxis response regulator protein-glutamate methylesterase [Psychrosphaera ytuae]
MTISVLVVDDSAFFRRRVTEILNDHPELNVIGSAADGREAVSETQRLKPDVITMDIEMPVLDGISAVREIMASTPTPIIMFSSLTHDGAKATLNALEAGALDFLPKRFEDIAKNKKEGTQLLQERVLQLGKGKRASSPARAPRAELSRSTLRSSDVSNRDSRTISSRTETRTSGFGSSSDLSRESTSSRMARVRERLAGSRELSSEPISRSESSSRKSDKTYKLVAIGTSTGGPVALQRVLSELPANFPLPILIVQHMPAAFTPAFASRLNNQCRIGVSEAKSGDVLKAGHAYLAPGGKQMLLEGRSGKASLVIRDDDSERLTYKPSVDLTFASAAKTYAGDVLAIILTGMGADGREGCRMLKQRGATVWAQDEETSVVYGMPQAVTVAGLAEKNLPLDKVGSAIMKEISSG